MPATLRASSGIAISQFIDADPGKKGSFCFLLQKEALARGVGGVAARQKKRVLFCKKEPKNFRS
jgi:hypothetical protein